MPREGAKAAGAPGESAKGIQQDEAAVTFMMAAPQCRHLFLADLELCLLPPLALKQCRLFTKAGRPIGLVTWAMLSDEVAERLKTDPQKRVKPADWRSGERQVIVDVVAPYGGAKEMV